MFRIEKKFDIAIGHRLSKHKGKCKSIHGHNLIILVGVKSEMLDENDMVIDFGDLKKYVIHFIETWDHSLMLNEVDKYLIDYVPSGTKTEFFKFDPTSERLSELLFNRLEASLAMDCENVKMDYVTIYENDGSKATFSSR